MIRALIEQTFDATKKYYVMCGLSTDTKPTSGLITGSQFHEVDTGTKYEFDEVNSLWHVVGITEDEIKAEIDAWLDDHPEATTTVEDGAISYAKLDATLKEAVDDVGTLNTEIQNKANVDGSYSSLTAGNAEQLVSTVGVTDKTPYLFRTTGGSADVGDRVKLTEITGGTVAWNQLATALTSANWTGNPAYGTTVFSNGVATQTITGESNNNSAAIYSPNSKGGIPITKGHKCFLGYTIKISESSNNVRVFVMDTQTLPFASAPANVATRIETVFESINDTGGNAYFGIFPKLAGTGLQNGATFEVSNVGLIDLTAMFGSTIADYLCALESGTAGAGVAKLKSWGFCTAPYYAYDAGSLLSVKTSAHKEIGFNQWDEVWEVGGIGAVTGENNPTQADRIRSKNYIPVVPSTTYFYEIPIDKGNMQIFYYDKSKNYITYYNFSTTHTFTTPADAYFIRFCTGGNYGTTYANDICINLHWDGERDGEYEPYEEHTYALDSDLELRGIPKLDANNNLYYDGDSYAASGDVTRRYGIVDLGTLTWTKWNDTNLFYAALTDKENTNDNIGICALYPFVGNASGVSSANTATTDKTMALSKGTQTAAVYIKDSAYSTAASFTTAMSGVYLVYELATPATESADPYQETQVCNDFGTEEFVDSRTVPMPVGYNAFYQANLRAKLEMAPDSPNGNGDYIVRQTDGLNEYVLLEKELPSTPAEDGTYTLKVTVADGTATLSWVADT